MITVSFEQFHFGDRLYHADRPEWGEGTVTAAVAGVQDGKACQRLTVRFERAGIKTLSTAHARLKKADDRPAIAGALEKANTDWLADLGAKEVQDVMTRLPEPATDPFASLEQRLKATLGLYRFGRTGGALIDWAASQSGLKDPLAKFNRHELEAFYKRFEANLEQHLKRLVGEMHRKDPGALAAVVATAPQPARDAVRRVDGR
ncbi:MAG: DUF3553 domain-containing protein [Phycisphaerales bacterium]